MRLSLPEIWIRPQSDVDLKDYEDKDAAAISAGDIVVYDLAIIEPRTDENWESPEAWEFLDSCGNYFGNPGNDNIYGAPQQIDDEFLRFYATDMWMFNLGIRPGSLFLHQGQVHAVLGLECEPYDMDSIGYATGFLVCRPMDGGHRCVCPRRTRRNGCRN